MEQVNTEWREGFLFVGNHTILNFLNTRPLIDGVPQELLADWQAVLRWFQTAEILEKFQAQFLAKRWEGAHAAEIFVENLQRFREDLRKVVIALEAKKAVSRKSVEELNRLLRAHRTYLKLFEENGHLQKTESFDLHHPPDLFGPLAGAAAELLTQIDFNRVRQCEGCVLHFYDESKNGARRWCSMNLCGNRAKVAAYARRQRKRAAPSR